MFYTFNQNDSGDSFHFNEGSGITHFVIIEATDLAHAMARASEIGLYFDGVRNGIDCACCGDRWSEPWKDDGEDVPLVYGEPPEEYEYGWMEAGKETAIHYAGGSIEWVGSKRRG